MLRVIVVTDHSLVGPSDVTETIAGAIRGGVGAVQLRMKGADATRMLSRAMELRALTHNAGSLCFVNDRIDVALAADADGVHLGPDDLPLQVARRLAPPPFLIGYSASSPEEAHWAEDQGADYIGCGAVFPTHTKPDAEQAIGLDMLRTVVESVRIPVVAIGGITAELATEVTHTGATGIAVVSSVMTALDPEEAARKLLAGVSEGVR